MKRREVFLLKEATVDLEEGRLFYDLQEKGVGDYFFDCLISDLECLRFYGGIILKSLGFIECLQNDSHLLFIMK